MVAANRRCRGAGARASAPRHCTAAALIVVCGLALASPAAILGADAGSCSAPGRGWCLARRFPGIVPGGELGFRFGEPLDADGDGRADVAAGARLKLQQGTLQNGFAAVWSGATGALIRAWDGDLPDGLFGHWVLPIPDLDGDGLADVVVAAPNARIDSVPSGVLVARSPKTDADIWRVTGSRNENFGWHLAVAGDQNGDGRTDLFVGAPSIEGGRVYLVSGKDGTTLRSYAPQRPTTSFGWYVAAVDDLDGDGRADVVVGAHRADGPRRAAGAESSIVGAAYMFASRSGTMLHHWKGTQHLSGFGEVVTAVGDLDGDGHAEVAIASPRRDEVPRAHAGDVRIYSGTSGKLLRHWAGREPGEIYGRMVVSAGDLDGDGIDDVAIGAPWYRHENPVEGGMGRVELRSGRDGAILGELVGDEPDGWFGWHIRRAPDPDGRDRPALLISSLRHSAGGAERAGVLDVYVLRRDDAPS